MGKRYRRSSTVLRPARSKSAARRGPTPFKYCSGVARNGASAAPSCFIERLWLDLARPGSRGSARGVQRSEEHTSELQSLAYLVCRLLLEKKKYTTSRRR